MASRAIIRRQRPSRTRMAHRRRCERCSVLMASIALCGSRDMCTGFALGGHAMAARATAGHWRADQCVIEDCAGEAGVTLMANIALRSRRQMVGRFRQRVGRDIGAAMAGCAVVWRQWSGGAGMAHRRRCERCRVLMAGIALRRGRDMRTGLTFGGHAMA